MATKDEISAEFQLAKKNLYGKESERNLEEGILHLLKAYTDAKECHESCHLLKARILYCMYRNFRENYDYVSEALREYKLALETADEKPTERELKEVQGRYDCIQGEILYHDYEKKQSIKCENHYEEMLLLIQNSKILTDADFSFHDSIVYSFEHKPEKHIVKLQLFDTWAESIATFLFENVNEERLQYLYELDYRWVFECCCYPDFYDKTYLVFDLDEFRIIAKKITVLDIHFLTEEEQQKIRVFIDGGE